MARKAQQRHVHSDGPLRTSLFVAAANGSKERLDQTRLSKDVSVRQLAAPTESDFNLSKYTELLFVDVRASIPDDDTLTSLRRLLNGGIDVAFVHQLTVPQLAALIDRCSEASFFLTQQDNEGLLELTETLQNCREFAERPFPIIAADGAIEVVTVGSLDEKPAILTAIQHAFSDVCRVPDRGNALLTAVDEVLVNAIRHGSRVMPPKSSVFGIEANSPRSKVQVSFGAKGEHFYVSIRDSGGQLNRKQLTRSLQVTEQKAANDVVSMKPGSAGVGLLMTATSVNRLDVFLHSGVETVFRIVQSTKSGKSPIASEICSVTVQSRGVDNE